MWVSLPLWTDGQGGTSHWPSAVSGRARQPRQAPCLLRRPVRPVRPAARPPCPSLPTEARCGPSLIEGAQRKVNNLEGRS